MTISCEEMALEVLSGLASNFHCILSRAKQWECSMP